MNITADKLSKRDILAIPVMLFAGAYLFCCLTPIFCEKMEEVSNRSAAVSENSANVQGDWYVIDTGYFTIYCDRNSDLKTIARKLGRRGLFTSGVYDPSPASSPSGKIAYRFTSLLRRAQDILDMRPNMKNLKVKIFKNRSQLYDEYYRIFGAAGEYESFYVYKNDTIYISEDTLSDNVVAHEMGHAVIDHYFSAVPPEKVRELLASYVDMHLEDDE